MSDHIYKPFDQELQALREQLLTMGALVQGQVAEAMKAFVDKDAERARRIIDGDRAVDQMELAIDELCIRTLALHAPTASDLRFVASSLKMVTDLERIGDLAVNMAQRVITVASEPTFVTSADLPEMVALAMRMLDGALAAFVASDTAQAGAVVAGDQAVDEKMRQVFDTVVGEMRRNPEIISSALASLFFAKHIERMADHATNVAEMVIYFVRGRDVRHGHH